MTASSTLPAPNLMPLMRYRDLAEAMGWLERAFGFEKQVAVSDNDGAVIYGQMTYRGGIMMMGAVRDTDLDKLLRQPDEVGDVETQSCYLVVDDADAHYAKAQDAGAEIVLELKSDGLGRRGYSCRDPEGHIWNFGTYNPGRGLTMPAIDPASDAAVPPPANAKPLLRTTIAGLVVAFGATCLWFADEIQGDFSTRVAMAEGRSPSQEAERAYAELVKVRAEKRKADTAAQAATKDLEAERARRLALESSSGSSAEQLAHEQNARRAAEAAVATLREELKRKQGALDDAVEAKRVSEEKLAVQSAAAESKRATPSEQITAMPQASGPDGTSAIETSATRPAPETFRTDEAVEDDDDDDERDVTSSRSKQSSRSSPRALSRNKRPVVMRSRRPVPTYVVNLHEVPWPYSTWYK